MKKNLGIVALTFLISLSAFSQNNNQIEYIDNEFYKLPRHEIRLNLLTSVLGIPELNYEYFIQDNFGIGLALQASVESFEDMSYRAGVLPYGRLYFGQKPNRGFFIEGNTGILFEKFYRDYWIQSQSTRQLRNKTNYGFGVGLGYKFMTKNNWVGDVQIGAGRIFGDTYFEAYPRFGISIGKRF